MMGAVRVGVDCVGDVTGLLRRMGKCVGAVGGARQAPTLPGLFKVAVQKVPAKAKRFGKDPFTGEERWFPATPASVKVKVRPLKKLKDAAQ